jgi:hypothetical protein
MYKWASFRNDKLGKLTALVGNQFCQGVLVAVIVPLLILLGLLHP